MPAILEVARTGLAAILLHPLRSVVTAASLVVILLPYLVGLGLSKGIQHEAEASVRFGADLYVTGEQFGRTVPIPVDATKEIKQIDGVTGVTKRIIGAITLGTYREPAVVVGIPRDKFPTAVSCVEGRLYNEQRTGNLQELVIGTELARRLALKVGSTIPGFSSSDQPLYLCEIVGIFKTDVSMWQANVVFTSFDTAEHIFNQKGLATDLLVTCRTGYQDNVRADIARQVKFATRPGEGNLRARVTTREDLEALLPRGLMHREGIFTLHFVLAFAVGILVVLVTSGVGLSERRREIGILKATGWQTDEVLLRSLVESFLLSLLAASVSILLAYAWLKWLNGYWIAGVFVAAVDAVPGFPVPFRLAPVPVLLAFVISFAVVMSGTLYSSWRAATVAPMEAMR